MNKRFSTNGYYIYDHFKDEERWLINAEAQDIVNMMNNLDIKARERSKALSTLQKKYDKLLADKNIDIHIILDLIKKNKKKFKLKDVCYDEEHYNYCIHYYDEAIGYLKGVLHYMRGE